MKIKNSLLLLALLILSLLSQSCSDDDDDPSREELLIGTWTLNSQELESIDVNGSNFTVAELEALYGDIDQEDFEIFLAGTTITFEEDQTFIIHDDDGDYEGSWLLQDDQETLIATINSLNLDFMINSISSSNLDLTLYLNGTDLGLDENMTFNILVLLDK